MWKGYIWYKSNYMTSGKGKTMDIVKRPGVATVLEGRKDEQVEHKGFLR